MSPQQSGPATVLVRGATLSGMAASARLAKAGHHVVLDADGLPDGGHWAVQLHRGVEVDELPQTFRLPAAWRDLFKKSGRALDAELARHQLQMVPAPPQVHRFADGRELVLPTERGAQVEAVQKAFGRPAALAWAQLVDRLDDLWQELRMVGLERPVTADSFDRPTRAALLGNTMLDELAREAGAPHLARIVESQAAQAGAPPGRAPALLGVRLAVQRRFGIWQLTTTQGQPVRASRLVDLLGERLDLRGVERTGSPAPLLGSGLPDLSRIDGGDQVNATVRLDALPHQPTGFGGRVLGRPAMAPTVRHQLLDAVPEELVQTAATEDSPLGIVEVVDHSAGAPVITWYRPLPQGGVALTVHDHNQPRPDLRWGLAPTSFRAWQRRPRLGGDGDWRASSTNHAGAEPWAELLTAALAVYEIHDFLTGDDIRPTNKEQPRLPRQARPATKRFR
ncbi:hypothetical protein ACTQ49_04060 [Luteococcus sp. Sow4_B9]|uniref:hypothetical protein n=1 Tax=Luteococcus sp. Sow4_B9 TaxID=3438792 RepID=UPI003F99D7CF